MALKLRLMSGPLKDKEFPLTEGVGIGRTQGEILLNDSKVSSLHAEVKAGASGLVLTDNGSKNGIRVGGQKVQFVDLRPGAVFEIGSSRFEVIATEEIASEIEKIKVDFQIDDPVTERRPKPAPIEPQSEEVTAKPPARMPSVESAGQRPSEPAVAEEDPPSPPTKTIALEPLKWSEVLERQATELGQVIQDQPRAIVALEPAVSLVFTRGLQAETRWLLGYGPRKAGATSLDLPIFEPKAPDICFEIIPTPDGVTFRSNHPNTVTFNGKAAGTHTLKSGDIIGIGGTRIEVEVIK